MVRKVAAGRLLHLTYLGGRVDRPGGCNRPGGGGPEAILAVVEPSG